MFTEKQEESEDIPVSQVKWACSVQSENSPMLFAQRSFSAFLDLQNTLGGSTVSKSLDNQSYEITTARNKEGCQTIT